MKSETKTVLINGIALFAMFFGAGNVVFPLALGAHAGSGILPTLIAFLIAGVGLPFLGVLSITLFKGDYWRFFAPLTKPLAFLVVTFLILIIGPLFAAPRTETVTFGSIQNLMPGPLQHAAVFSALYFLVVFLIAARHSHLTTILGKILGPVKILTFVALIVVSLTITHHPEPSAVVSSWAQATHALSMGYSTMDLLAAFFFGGIIYHSIVQRCHAQGIDFKVHALPITVKSCMVGASLLAIIYAGFMLSAWSHAALLQNTPTASIVSALALVVFGKVGNAFVCVCITLTCLATASALAEVSTHYFYHTVFRNRIPRSVCLLLVLTVMYAMSLLGFDTIVAIAVPVLNYLYPILIVFCVVRLVGLLIQRRAQNNSLHKI